MNQPLDRRTFCRSTLAGAAAAGLGVGRAQSAERPSVLLITTDDMGPQLGCYGDPDARTPNLDRLAAEGTLFDRAYVTQASCSPSRSSIFTGLYPHQNGQIGLSHRHYSMHRGMRTLPAILDMLGYHTGVIGKVHVAPNRAVPFDRRSSLKVVETREVAQVADEAAVQAISKGRPVIDGVNVWGTLLGKSDAPHPRKDLLYWHGAKGFHAIRVGDWKLFLDRKNAGLKGEATGPALFNLAKEPGEKTDLSAQFPDKVKEMQALAEKRLADINKNVIPLAEAPRKK